MKNILTTERDMRQEEDAHAYDGGIRLILSPHLYNCNRERRENYRGVPGDACEMANIKPRV